MLKSSILGQDFVNYRKTSDSMDRLEFSHRIRSKGIGYIPIVVDSVDEEISDILGTKEKYSKSKIRYGFEVMMHLDAKVTDLIKEIKIEFVRKDYIDYTDIILGLEDGSILNGDEELGNIYKKHRNEQDKILYVLVTKENTMFGYILSILKYLSLKSKESMKYFYESLQQSQLFKNN